MLLAAGLDLPKKVFIHGHWTRDGRKMSKSLSNFVTPELMLETVNNQSDAVRWFILTHARYENVDFNDEMLRIQSDTALGNKLGNLLNRVTGKINPTGAYPEFFPEFMPRKEQAFEIVAKIDNCGCIQGIVAVAYALMLKLH